MRAVSPGPQPPSNPHLEPTSPWSATGQISDSAAMAHSLHELPDDVESLKALLLAVQADNARLTARNERLDHIIAILWF